MFKRIEWLWNETGTGRDGQPPEPGEAKFRTLVLLLVLVLGTPFLLFVYFKFMFFGLTNPDALDYAQLGRNLAEGHGFVTGILRPLALTHGTNPLAQPDMTHGPLYPFLLALAFGILGAKDTTVALLSGLFYLLTIPVVYRMGQRVFSPAVGLLAALIFTLNALLLEYAASGLHITLFVFLMTCLLLVVFEIAHATRNSPDQWPRGRYLLAGVLSGLLYLTDPLFIWILPFLLGGLFMQAPTRKGPCLLAVLLPALLLILPWMGRNLLLTGNPVFGLRGMEIWMNTEGHYPGATAYRHFPADIVPGVEVFKAVVQKILLGLAQIVQAFPQVTASWALAFFLPSLLFRFKEASTNALRRMMLLCLLALVIGSLLFRVQMPIFVAVIPTMLVFSLAYLLHATQQAQMRPGPQAMVIFAMALSVALPLLNDMVLTEKTPGLKEASLARLLTNALRREEVVLSDQPGIVAWYAGRPALLAPMNDTRLGELRKQFPGMRWLFLTENTPGLSAEWRAVYEAFARWNAAYAQAAADKQALDAITITGKGTPLLEGLEGFTSVPPAPDTTLSVVVATLPDKDRKVGYLLPPARPSDAAK